MTLTELMQQRAAQPQEPANQARREKDIFLQNLMLVTFLGIRQKMEDDAEPIVDYLRDTLAQPEALLVICALAYVQSDRLAIAETMLREVLMDCPDYEPAQVCLAAVWALLNKEGSLSLVERTLVTSVDPMIRAAAQKIVDSHALEVTR